MKYGPQPSLLVQPFLQDLADCEVRIFYLRGKMVAAIQTSIEAKELFRDEKNLKDIKAVRIEITETN